MEKSWQKAYTTKVKLKIVSFAESEGKPTLLEVVEWVLSVWNELNPAIIKKGFLKCCISNNLDGSQDDILWREEEEEEEEENVEENDDDILYYDGPEHDVVEQALADETENDVHEDDEYFV